MKLSDFRGQVVVVFFFADWCPVCREMYGVLNRLTSELAGKPIVVLGVCGDSRKTLQDLARSGRITWKNILSPMYGESSAFNTWQYTGVPNVFVIDQSGKLVLRVDGGLDVATMVRIANYALNGKSAAQSQPRKEIVRSEFDWLERKVKEHGDDYLRSLNEAFELLRGARSSVQEEDVDRIERLYARSGREFPKESGVPLWWETILKLARGDEKKATKSLTELLRMDGTRDWLRTEARIQLAYLLAGGGEGVADDKRAAETVKEAMRDEEALNSWQIARLLEIKARLLLDENQIDEARDCLEVALENVDAALEYAEGRIERILLSETEARSLFYLSLVEYTARDMEKSKLVLELAHKTGLERKSLFNGERGRYDELMVEVGTASN